MSLYRMLGYKLFKQDEDGNTHMLRIVHMHKPYKITSSTKEPSEITVYDYDTKERKKVRTDSLKDYSPLKPDAIITLAIATINVDDKTSYKDVIITGTKYLNVEVSGGKTLPYVICRQNVTDVFYNILTTDEEHMMSGISISQDTCPTNVDFTLFLSADGISKYEFLNMYRTDTLEDVFKLVNLERYDAVLKDLYDTHVKYVNIPELAFKHHHEGWCDSVKELITQNHFKEDINQMLGITDLGFNIKDYLEERPLPGHEGQTYLVARDDFRYWLSSIYKINMREINFIEYDHDINMGDFNNATYMLLRGTDNVLYLAVYLVDGEYLESDLEAKAKELDFSTKFKIDFANSKYMEMISKHNINIPKKELNLSTI